MIQDILTQGNSVFSHLSAEAEAVKAMGTAGPDIQIRRNELLLRIADQITEVNRTLEYVDILHKELKTHVGKLRQLRKILSK